MIDGAKIKMGDQEWIVPALSFGQLKRLMPKINKLSTVSSDMDDEQMDAITDVVQAAMSRNYPDMTVEKVADMLDMANAGQVVRAVMGQSGLVQSGEAQAGNR